MRALVIGGTGPTGPHVLTGLLHQGMEVTMMHRGVHEPTGLPDIEHLHADPHFVETIDSAIHGRSFDVVVAMYGRVTAISEAFAHRCGHLVAVGGAPVYRGYLAGQAPRPTGVPLGAREDAPQADQDTPAPKFAAQVLAAERSVFAQRDRGAYMATVVRYPRIYGPRNIVPWEWSVVRRVLDGRRFIILPDGGLGIATRCAARNAAEVLLTTIERPELSDGQAYNCADDDQYTFRQWVEIIAAELGSDLAIESLPVELCHAAYVALTNLPGYQVHVLLDASKARNQLGARQVVSARQAIAENVRFLLDGPPPRAPASDPFDYEAEDRLVETYRIAAQWVLENAAMAVPELGHPMPHPRMPTLGLDEKGR
jgi:nucleoside-diphosphate-sugar epimerase